MTKRNLSSVVTLANTCKFAANTMMAMLFMVLTSCSGEKIGDHHPAQAKSLMTSVDSTMSLGKTVVDFAGSATTATNENISGEGNLTYTCMPKVYVDVLGLPTDVTANNDGTFTSSDGNTFNRSFSWQGNGVNGSSTPTWERTIILNEINDSTELVEAQFEEEWSIWTSLLPSEGNYTSSKSGKELVRVQYLRVVKPEAPKPIEITYRKSLVLDLEDTKGGIYADLLVEKLQGTEVLEKWSCYGVMATWGEYKPQVSAQSVSSFEFTSHDKAGEAKELEADVPGLGDKGTYTRKNIRHTAETFEVQFPSTADADGNTIRPIRGQIDLWVYSYEFVNPEDNHTEDFSVEVEVVSTKSEVNNSTYERTIEIRINGEVVDVQNGKVELTIG
jgi:hypothetical protein